MNGAFHWDKNTTETLLVEFVPLVKLIKMTSTITYQGELRTTCTHIKSNETIITDAPTDNNGKGEAFSPTDLVATALASCMETVMGIKSKKMDIDITGTTAEIKKVMTNNPRRIEKIAVVISFPKNNWSEEIKTRLIKIAENCPVAKSVHSDILQEITYNF